MDNQNSMLGLLGMESTSFLEELSRTDEVSSVPSRGGGAVANGTMLPQDAVSGPVEMQQRMPQQASWGINQMPHTGVMHYQNTEYGQYNAAAKQQQRMVHMSGYGSGMMPTGNSGSLQNHPNAAQYGYSGMSGMHNVAMTPPRQALSGAGVAWNHSPGSGGITSDPLASQSYAGMTAQHGGMVQQHRANVPQQVQMSANRSNGMQGQMYGQYHDFATAGTMQQTRMMGYSDSQNQIQEMGMSGGYCQPIGSPPPASTRLMQMSGQAGQMPSQVHYQQQRYPSMSASVDSSHYISDSQPHHSGSGHVVNQYQYNSAMMGQGQPRMPGDGYGQFYAQPLYRVPGYGATTQAQAQMMSPNAMAQMSPQARSSGSARPPDIRSPQPTQVPVCSVPRPSAISGSVPMVSASASFRPNIPSHTVTYTVAANSTALVGTQRMPSVDGVKAAYPSAMQTVVNPSAAQQLMVGSAARYAVPGYQMNTMPGTELRHQLYAAQQPQVMDAPDRPLCFPQSHSQGYYQPVTLQQQQPQQQQQQSQYAAPAVMMGGLSPGHMTVHKQSQMPLQQQQLMPPGQAITSSVSVVHHSILLVKIFLL